MKNPLLLSGILLIFFSCNPAEKNQKNALNYFDLKGYFAKEAARLNKSKPLLTKTVEVNKDAETRKLRITDWNKELSIFSDADINRNAWKDLFNRKDIGEGEIYTTGNEKIPVKEVLVTKKNGQVQGIRIMIRYNNMLYSSADTLAYYPDSLYQVKKQQKIRLLSEKNYRITGKLF